MTAYPENTGGIIAAINACIVAAGGQLATYNNNTGGIIQALIALQTAIGGMGGGSAVEIELEAAEDLSVGDAVYINGGGQLAKAIHSSTRDIATVAGIVKENVAATSLGVLVFSGKIDVSGWGSGSLSPGDRYFLNGDGLMSTAPPTGSGEYITLVGEALDANTLAINIDTPVLLS